MGKFFVSKIWLEDREIEILEEYDFTEEVWESDIPKDKHWVLSDLCNKSFLHLGIFEGETYYQASGGYLQHFK